MDTTRQELESIRGVGRHAVILFKLVKDMRTMYLIEKAKENPQVTCTRDLLDYCRSKMGGLKDEQFHVIYLDAQNKIIDTETIQESIVNQAVVFTREKFLKMP